MGHSEGTGGVVPAARCRAQLREQGESFQRRDAGTVDGTGGAVIAARCKSQFREPRREGGEIGRRTLEVTVSGQRWDCVGWQQLREHKVEGGERVRAAVEGKTN